MAYWKIEAQGDTVYVEANDEYDAKQFLTSKMGFIPASLITVTKTDELPEGEELL